MIHEAPTDSYRPASRSRSRAVEKGKPKPKFKPKPFCRDCRAEGITHRRPIASGTRYPRCDTHTRAARKLAKANQAGRKLVSRYGMTPQQYAALYAAQNGLCAICHVARGIARRLAVDHDHKAGCGHPPETGCPRCWRGLLCKRCNQLIGWYSAEQLTRAVAYLNDPPARRLNHAQR